MEFADRLGWWLFGCAVGFILGYIVRYLREIKEEVHEVDELVKKIDKEGGFVRYPYVADVMLIVVVLVTVWAAFLSQKASNDVRENYEQDQVARCKAGADYREVQRDLVEQIYILATGSIQRDADSPPLTDYELGQYNAYIDRVNNFRTEMYKKIHPSSECASFVEDDNVKPPTPPVAHIKK